MKGPVQFEPVLFYSSIGAVRKRLLLHAQQFDIEHQRRVRRNGAPGAPRTVTQRGGNDQRSLAANFHGGHAFIPAGDDALLSNRNSNGSFRSTELSNFLPFLPSSYSHPV